MEGFGSAQFDRRRYPRLDFKFPLAFRSVEQDLPPGVSQNVSLGGLLAYLPHLVTPGQLFDITMLLMAQDGPLTIAVKAQVVWAQAILPATEWVCRAGLKFLEFGPEDLNKWRQFLLEWKNEKA